MGLFRPYERKDETDDGTKAEEVAKPTKRRQSMVIAPPATPARTTSSKSAPARSAPAQGAPRAKTGAAKSGSTKPGKTGSSTTSTTEPTNAELDALRPDVAELEALRPRGPQPKTGPTPTRKQAEAARKERLNPSLSPKESRQLASANQREARAKQMSNADAAPERALLRDYIDRRFNLGEFLLPACLVILALTFLNSAFPGITWITTAVMYLFIMTVLADCFFMWRGYKKLLGERHPNAPTKGLLFYGINRTIQIRRLRMPRPRVKRGEAI